MAARSSIVASWKAAGQTALDASALERTLQSLYAEGSAAWPAIELGFDAFVDHVAAVTPKGASLVDLEGLSGEGLYLSAACTSGNAKAASVFVEDAGWKVGEVGDAGSFPTSSVMFEDGFKSDAETLASDLSDQLGDLDVILITPEVADVAGGADLALVVGQDDQGIAG